MGTNTLVDRAVNATASPFIVAITGPGVSPAATGDSRREMFRFRFGAEAAGECAENVFPVTIECFGAERCCDEIWFSDESITASRCGDIRIVQSESWLALHYVSAEANGKSFCDMTEQAYRELIQIAMDRSYPELLRAWNFFPGINDGTGDDERYKQFSIGRARALEKLGISNNRIPAGTAIGTTAGTDVSITLLASRQPCSMIKNPRQINPCDYPARFGSRSPSFSRAALLATNGSAQLFLSGTASIVGFESRHIRDVEQQLDETLANINAVIVNTPELRQHDLHSDQLGRSLRVYVRDPNQVQQIRELLEARIGVDQSVVYLIGDICRNDLLLEIEGLLWFRGR